MQDRIVYLLSEGRISSRLRVYDVPHGTWVYDPVYNRVIDVQGVNSLDEEENTLYRDMEKAIALHGDQLYGERPYSVHLHAVWAYARDFELDIHQQRLAIYHDVLEDCGIAKESFAQEHGEDLAEDVWACSGEGSNRVEKQSSIKRKLLLRPSAINIKMLDRCTNMHASKGNVKKGGMYLREVADWEDILNHPQADPRIVALFRTIASDLQSSLDNTSSINRAVAP